MSLFKINDLYRYITNYTSFSTTTINNVISKLGYNPKALYIKDLQALSQIFKDCSEHGADSGFPGFCYYNETSAFFIKNRYDIVNSMEQSAAQLGTDIISMVQNFGVFRNSEKPTPSEIGRALWDSTHQWSEFTSLYNVFAWYTLEEISHTWNRYLDEDPDLKCELLW